MRNLQIEAVERRRRWLRAALFVVILGTLPFYCAGFLLWGTAPRREALSTTPLASLTPIGAGLTPTVGLPTVTPLLLTLTSLSPLQPTPLQFIPPQRPQATLPGVLPTAFIPTSTLAPSLTPFPTVTPAPSLTPILAASSTPLPPLPTETPTLAPSETPIPTNTDVPALPTETPIPFDVPTIDPGSGGS